MQRKTNFLPVTAAVVLAASLGFASLGALAGGKGITAAATGSGQLTTPSGAWRTFAFTAVTDGSGVTSGQAQFHNHMTGFALHLNITCLHIEGNVATISGNISDPNIPDLDSPSIIFQVEDNGEDAKATEPDMISPVDFEPPHFFHDCAYFSDSDFGLGSIEAGNIQVH